MSTVIGGRTFYDCCQHCEHDDVAPEVELHDDRCPEGCNDGE